MTREYDAVEESYLEEIRLYRALAREIQYSYVSNGESLPLNIVLAYNDLHDFYEKRNVEGIM